METKEKIVKELQRRINSMTESQISEGVFFFYVDDNYINDEIKKELYSAGSKINTLVQNSKNKYLQEQATKKSSKSSKKVSSLLKDQKDILKLRKAGLSYQKIAEKYNVSRTTMTKFIKSL